MTYCTLADLVARAGLDEIVQVSDRDRDGEPDPDVVAAAIAAAAVDIETWLAARYALPIIPVPDAVRKWAVAIARYTLHRDGAPDHVVRDQRDAVAALQAAATGKLSLPATPAGTAPAPASSGGMGVLSDHPAFGPDRLKDFL